MTVKVRVVNVDDWAGLYIDGELAYESHSIPLDVLFSKLKKAGLDIDAEHEWDQKLERALYSGTDPFNGGMPKRYADLESFRANT